MGVLDDVRNLDTPVHQIIIYILTVGPVWYLSLYFLNHESFLVWPFEVAILFTLVLSFGSYLLDLLLSHKAHQTYLTRNEILEKNDDENKNSLFLILFIAIMSFSLLGLSFALCYYLDLSFRSFIGIYVVLVYSLSRVLRIVNKHSSNNEEKPPPKS